MFPFPLLSQRCSAQVSQHLCLELALGANGPEVRVLDQNKGSHVDHFLNSSCMRGLIMRRNNWDALSFAWWLFLFLPLPCSASFWTLKFKKTLISIFKLHSENLTSNWLHVSLIKFSKLASELNAVWYIVLLSVRISIAKVLCKSGKKRFHHNHFGFCLRPHACL